MFTAIKRVFHVRSNPVLLQQIYRSMVSSTEDDGVFYIALNRPEKRNAVSQKVAADLYQAFKTFESSETAKIGILHGNGGNFCSGYDLQELSEGSKLPDEFIDWKYTGQAPMGPSRMQLKKPLIAAISGYAVAGGLELALLCDLRVVEDTAIFGVFCRRFGVPLIDGGTVRLQKLIGLSRALDLILTGRAVTAREAFEIGLANRLVPEGQSLAEATKLAREIIKFPSKCMLADRQSAYYTAYQADSIEDALKYEYINGLLVVQQESIPGAKKFMDGEGKHGQFNSKL